MYEGAMILFLLASQEVLKHLLHLGAPLEKVLSYIVKVDLPSKSSLTIILMLPPPCYTFIGIYFVGGSKYLFHRYLISPCYSSPRQRLRSSAHSLLEVMSHISGGISTVVLH